MKRQSKVLITIAVVGVLISCGFGSLILAIFGGWNHPIGSQGTTPLFFAKTVTEAEALVAKGYNVNQRSNFGYTPLHFAAARGQPDLVAYLIAHGAEVNVSASDGETPLHWATKTMWDPDEGLHYIAEPFDPKLKLESARLLVEHGAKVDAKGPLGGQTPLFDAAREDLELTKFLLDAGANADARSEDGYSPLHHTRSAKITELLISRGADVNARDKWEHRTPLYFATDPEIAAVLTAHGGTK